MREPERSIDVGAVDDVLPSEWPVYSWGGFTWCPRISLFARQCQFATLSSDGVVEILLNDTPPFRKLKGKDVFTKNEKKRFCFVQRNDDCCARIFGGERRVDRRP